MKTKQGKVVRAYATLQTMARKQMNSLTAYKLFKLKKALAPIVEFQSEEELRTVRELGGTINETGSITIEDIEKRREYMVRHHEMEEMECEVETERIKLAMQELDNISLADMDALDEFVDFEE